MFIHTDRGGKVSEEAAGDEELLGGGNSQQLQPLQQLQEEGRVGVEEHFCNIHFCEICIVCMRTITLLKSRLKDSIHLSMNCIVCLFIDLLEGMAIKKFRKSERF